MRHEIQGPGPSKDGVLQIEQGGTSAVTNQEALENLGAIGLQEINIPGGIAGYQPNINLIPPELLPEDIGDSSAINMDGPVSMQLGDTIMVKITNFDSFTDYVLTANKVTVEREDDTLLIEGTQFGDDAWVNVNGSHYPLNVTIPNPPLTGEVEDTEALKTGSLALSCSGSGDFIVVGRSQEGYNGSDRVGEVDLFRRTALNEYIREALFDGSTMETVISYSGQGTKVITANNQTYNRTGTGSLTVTGAGNILLQGQGALVTTPGTPQQGLPQYPNGLPPYSVTYEASTTMVMETYMGWQRANSGSPWSFFWQDGAGEPPLTTPGYQYVIFKQRVNSGASFVYNWSTQTGTFTSGSGSSATITYELVQNNSGETIYSVDGISQRRDLGIIEYSSGAGLQISLTRNMSAPVQLPDQNLQVTFGISGQGPVLSEPVLKRIRKSRAQTGTVGNPSYPSGLPPYQPAQPGSSYTDTVRFQSETFNVSGTTVNTTVYPLRDYQLGGAVDVSNNQVLVVGCPRVPNNQFNNGGTLEFRRWNGTAWTTQKFTNASVSPYPYFGHAVKINADGTRAFATQPGINNFKCYTSSGGNFTEVASVTNSGISSTARFGECIDVTAGDTHVAIGAPGQGANGTIYLYSRSTNTFTLADTITVAGLPEGFKIGHFVKILSSTRLFVSVRGTDDSNSYVIDLIKENGVWGVSHTFENPSPATPDKFGQRFDVATDASVIAVSAPGTGTMKGSFHLWIYMANRWNFFDTIVDPDGVFGDKFAHLIEMSDDGKNAHVLSVNGAADKLTYMT